MTTPYEMAVNNVARFISNVERNGDPESSQPENRPITAFTASVVLGAAFCKASHEVLCDIVAASTV